MKLSAAYLKRVEEWKREGKQEGRQEGRQEIASEIAINMLREGIVPEVVARVTKLPIAEVEQLRANLPNE